MSFGRMVWTDKKNASSIVAKKQKEPGQGHRGQIAIKNACFKLFSQ